MIEKHPIICIHLRKHSWIYFEVAALSLLGTNLKFIKHKIEFFLYWSRILSMINLI